MLRFTTAQHIGRRVGCHLIVGGSGGFKLAVELCHVRVSLAKARLIAAGPCYDGWVVLVPLYLQSTPLAIQSIIWYLQSASSAIQSVMRLIEYHDHALQNTLDAGTNLFVLACMQTTQATLVLCQNCRQTFKTAQARVSAITAVYDPSQRFESAVQTPACLLVCHCHVS